MDRCIHPAVHNGPLSSRSEVSGPLGRVFGVPLLLVDLDNTLIDRAGAFERWARAFVSARRGDAGDAAWLVTADRDGLEPRGRLAWMIAERFGLDARDEGAVLAELLGGLVGQLAPDDAVTRALRRAWEPGHVADSFPHAVGIVLGS
jgi:FMN phosphatase YigB (HAD superfamily)